MLALCFVLLLNQAGQENAINIKQIQAIEDNDSSATIFMSVVGLKLYTKEPYKKVMKKIKETEESCRL